MTSKPSGAGDLVCRRWHQGDSVSELTSLLHRAYQPLAARGMNFRAATQDDEATLNRISEGACWVVFQEARLVGTVTVLSPSGVAGCEWYDRSDVAAFGQFAVDPALQGCGIGSRLLALVEEEAALMGASELALDTSEDAHDLIAWYLARGFRQVDRVDWPFTNFLSVVLSKGVTA